MLNIFYYSLIPAFCLLIGSSIASIFKPSLKCISATQHFAAGIVFSAVAKELIPHLGAGSSAFVLATGFLMGLVSMLCIKSLTEKLFFSESDTSSRTPWGMVAAVGVDVFLDGVLIGIAFLVGKSGGILIAIALAVEILFLGLSTAATLSNKAIPKSLILICMILLSLLLPLGAVGGASMLESLPAFYMTGLIAFGVAALLYLVTEELLLEAHDIQDTPLITAFFFIGFLLILVLDNLSN